LIIWVTAAALRLEKGRGRRVQLLKAHLHKGEIVFSKWKERAVRRGRVGGNNLRKEEIEIASMQRFYTLAWQEFR
jgi:hypothetical protein